MIDAVDIHVKGIVQGVGFRPFVYRMAKKYLINGWVLNATDGVHIHAEGESALVDEFIMELSDNAPAASRVEEIDIKEVPLEDFDSFEIRFSDGSCSDSGGVNSQTVCRHPVWHPSVGTAVTDRIADAVYNILIRNGEACVFHHIGKIAEPQSVIAGSAVRGINHSAVCSCAAAAMDKIGGEST